MNLLEKYLKDKKAVNAKVEEIQNECTKMCDEVGHEFLEKFKAMIANASDEEFCEFMHNGVDELDTIELMAALTARCESYEKKGEESDDKPKKNGRRIVIVGLD